MDHAEKIRFRIVEDAWIARLAAYVLKGQKVAIVIGHCIYLHKTKKDELLTSTSWLRHELMHVLQVEREGILLFLIKYSWETLRKGYWGNCYEIEARAMENVLDFEKKFRVVSRRRSE